MRDSRCKAISNLNGGPLGLLARDPPPTLARSLCLRPLPQPQPQPSNLPLPQLWHHHLLP